MSNVDVKSTGVHAKKTEEGYVPSEHLLEPEKLAKLPPGARQVEYLEFIPPKLYTLCFKGEDLARMQELLRAKDLDPASHIEPSKAKILIDEYRLIVPETFLSSLTKDEQNKAEMFVPPMQVQYQVPVLYRFIKECYAKELIEKGKLRISSFERCRKCEGGCGERFDKGEGSGTFSIKSGTITAEFGLQTGGDPLMFCMSLSPEARRANGDICVEIFDVLSLINAISNGLIEKGITIKRIMHGPCSYADRLFERKCIKSKDMLDKLLGQTTNGSTSFDFSLLCKIPLTEIGERHYFTKPLRFSDEHEYRIVWDCESVPEEGFIDVELKDPHSFCRLYENKDLMKA